MSKKKGTLGDLLVGLIFIGVIVWVFIKMQGG